MGIHLRSEASRSCGCLSVEACKKRIGEYHHRWRGGKYINEAGYVVISEPGGPAFYEHVAVMEKEMGRKINRGETIHHKNGIRHDNHIENLELWASNHPSGQRVEDLKKWAIEILKRHSPEVLR